MDLPKAQQYLAKITEKYPISANERYYLVKLEFVNPLRMEFLAGQYVSVKVSAEGERRSYSIASTPDVLHGVTLVVEIVTNGLGSKFWQDKGVGEEVEMVGPMGQFVVQKEGEKKVLFAATGSGIVPVKSMIEDLLINKSEQKPLRLHWGMRSEEDLFWLDDFERLAEEHPNFVFDLVLSRPSEEWELCTGYVQDCLRRDFGSTSLPQVGLAGWEAYVCGATGKVESIKKELCKLGMVPKRILTERF